MIFDWGVVLFSFIFFFVGCLFGYFGSVCNESCNINCLCKNDIFCDYIGGECLNGCEDGYIGIYCNDCKKIKNLLKVFILFKKKIVLFFKDYYFFVY